MHFLSNVFSPDPTLGGSSANAVLSVDGLEMYAVENATNHRTDKYELVSEQRTPVLRRAETFYMAVKFKGERGMETHKDRVRVVFEMGENKKRNLQ